MSETVTGTISNAYYDEKPDVVVIEMELDSGETRTLKWPRDKFLKCMGKPGVLTRKVARSDFHKFKGKQDVTVHYEPMDVTGPDLDDRYVDDVNKAMSKYFGKPMPKYEKKKFGNIIGPDGTGSVL